MKEKIATFFGKVKDFYTSEDTKKRHLSLRAVR